MAFRWFPPRHLRPRPRAQPGLHCSGPDGPRAKPIARGPRRQSSTSPGPSLPAPLPDSGRLPGVRAGLGNSAEVAGSPGAGAAPVPDHVSPATPPPAQQPSAPPEGSGIWPVHQCPPGLTSPRPSTNPQPRPARPAVVPPLRVGGRAPEEAAKVSSSQRCKNQRKGFCESEEMLNKKLTLSVEPCYLTCCQKAGRPRSCCLKHCKGVYLIVNPKVECGTQYGTWNCPFVWDR